MVNDHSSEISQVAVMDPDTAGLNDLAEIVARERSSAMDIAGRMVISCDLYGKQE